MIKKEKYQYFEEQVMKWADYFGLKHWMIKVNESDEVRKGSAADVTTYSDSKVAFIRVNESFLSDQEIGKMDIQIYAFHEVFHTVLAELSDKACEMFSWKHIEPIEEGIVQLMINTVFPDVVQKENLERKLKQAERKINQLEKRANA